MYILVELWNVVYKSMMRILTTGWPVKNGYAPLIWPPDSKECQELSPSQNTKLENVSLQGDSSYCLRRDRSLARWDVFCCRASHCCLLFCQSLLSVVLLPWLTSQCWLLPWLISYCRLLSWRAFEWVYSHGSFVLITGRNLDWPYPGALPKREPCCIVRNLKWHVLKNTVFQRDVVFEFYDNEVEVGSYDIGLPGASWCLYTHGAHWALYILGDQSADGRQTVPSPHLQLHVNSVKL